MSLTPRIANVPELRDPITRIPGAGGHPALDPRRVPSEHEAPGLRSGLPSDRLRCPKASVLYRRDLSGNGLRIPRKVPTSATPDRRLAVLVPGGDGGRPEPRGRFPAGCSWFPPFPGRMGAGGTLRTRGSDGASLSKQLPTALHHFASELHGPRCRRDEQAECLAARLPSAGSLALRDSGLPRTSDVFLFPAPLG